MPGLYPRVVNDMLGLYPECWGFSVEGEELMRLERMPQLLCMIREDAGRNAEFKSLPLRDDVSKLFLDAANNGELWQNHVHYKCLAFRTSQRKANAGQKCLYSEVQAPGHDYGYRHNEAGFADESWDAWER